MAETLGKCNWCKQPIPSTNIDGTPCREGYEYKQVMQSPNIQTPPEMWHHRHPLYPDCFRLEAANRNSPWYDDPRRFLENDDNILPSKEDE